MSDWIEALRAECRRTSQAKVSARIGYSTTTISQVLSGHYAAGNKSIEAAVRGALMGDTVDCPVAGEIPLNRCIDYQRRAGAFAATNPMRVQLHKHCPTCEKRKELGN